jgi:hypothetical protein
MKTVLISISICLFNMSFANAESSEKIEEKRKPSSVVSTIWETREIPAGKACPAQAQRYDDIAYQVGGNGGYVCFTCDYIESTPLLVVAEQSRCNKNIVCKNGKCK